MDSTMKCYLNGYYESEQQINYNPDFNPNLPIDENNLPF